MRESPMFEVRLRRFDVWRTAVAIVALLAIAAVSRWAWSNAAARVAESVAPTLAIAAVLAVATLAAWRSLARVVGGVLGCRDDVWTFVPDSGPVVVGRLTVALDWGAFLLLRIDSQRGRVWLPVQRPGLERDWHALRCAVHATPRAAAASPRTRRGAE